MHFLQRVSAAFSGLLEGIEKIRKRLAIISKHFRTGQSIERSLGFSGLSEGDPEAIYPKPWDSHGIPTSSHGIAIGCHRIAMGYRRKAMG